MSATNKTQHYNLPQFVAGDIPAWMTDVNNAMATIDGAIYDVASDEATVGESVAQLGSRVTTAENTVASLGTTVQGVQSDVAENTADIATLEGNVNGLGTRTTTVEGKVTTLEGKVATLEGETAEDIPYDNSDSGLTATDVQGAIDELAQGGGSGVRLIATAQANQTYVEQCPTLYTAYQTLTMEEKLHSIVVRDDNVVLSMSSLNTGTYSRHGENTEAIYGESLALSLGRYIASTGTTIQNQSSDPNTGTLKLYVLG